MTKIPPGTASSTLSPRRATGCRRSAHAHLSRRGAGREYRIQEGELPFFMHRERGLLLDEPDVTVDGAPISASILGTALTLFYAGRAHAERGQGIYFYLPKMESAEEAGFWRDFFDASRERLSASCEARSSRRSRSSNRFPPPTRWRRCSMPSVPTPRA